MMRWTARDGRALAGGLAYLAPSFLLFAAFVFVPLGRTIYLSFFYTRQSGAISTFAGLDQYAELLASPVFHSPTASAEASSPPSLTRERRRVMRGSMSMRPPYAPML